MSLKGTNFLLHRRNIMILFKSLQQYTIVKNPVKDINHKIKPHAILNDLYHAKIADASVFVDFIFDFIPVPIAAVAGNLDVEFFKNRLQMGVKGPFRHRLSVIIENGFLPFQVYFIEGYAPRVAADKVNQPNIPASKIFCHKSVSNFQVLQNQSNTETIPLNVFPSRIPFLTFPSKCDAYHNTFVRRIPKLFCSAYCQARQAPEHIHR